MNEIRPELLKRGVKITDKWEIIEEKGDILKQGSESSEEKSTKSTKRINLTKKMKDLLIILKANAGRIQVSCNKANIHRTTYYLWLNKNYKFKQSIEDINEGFKDFVEGKIVTHIDSSDDKISADMCKFYAKTKMKERGYVERTELDQNIKSDNKIQVEVIKITKKEDEEKIIKEKIAIAGVPKAGKTTLTKTMKSESIYHTDDLIELGWSEASQEASTWFNKDEFIIEGVAVPRALRKWLAANKGKPCDKVIWLGKPHIELNPGQATMAKGCIKVFNEIEPELLKRGVIIEKV